MTATQTRRPHYTDPAAPDTECAECGHCGTGEVPGCRCGAGTDSACDPPTTTPVGQIIALRTEAGQAGDLDQVAICNAALNGYPDAIAECKRVIAEGSL